MTNWSDSSCFLPLDLENSDQDSQTPFVKNSLSEFISFLTSVRARRRDVFQRSKFLKPENIVWYANDQTTPNWEDTASRFLAMWIKAESEEETTEPKKNDLFIGFNASDHPEKVILPSLPDGRSEWKRLVDTALPFPGFFLCGRRDRVYSASLRKHYILEHEEWKEDIFPEILDGHNGADFLDPDILLRLEDLEREEAIRQADGEEEDFEMDGEELTKEQKEQLAKIRNKKVWSFQFILLSARSVVGDVNWQESLG
ncbi:hypothetical protein Bca52824_023925 [Brassica carinata]|uniref:NOG C-terminal domain-containing protein n=1 Tax=Brassica carinata TaxID=52824 RepID=A0A8X8AV65_BRACI|nr:hypothetical protein Bca52824_023925 [Brassica carinata]